MIKVILTGCNGHMGQVITDLCADDPDVEIVAGVDINTEEKNGYPVFADIKTCDVDADVIIDFSNVSVIDALLDFCEDQKMPVVLCTTGLTDNQLKRVEEVSTKVPVLKSANMSLGINVLMELLKTAAKMLAPSGFDIEIVEKHHNRKLDAPSGTALALADVMNDALEDDYSYTFDRSQQRKKRDKYEIGISAVRGGNIVGEHEVIFAGMDEVLTFKHTAYSRAIFGKGAIEAAKYIVGKPAAHYDMSDVIKGK